MLNLKLVNDSKLNVCGYDLSLIHSYEIQFNSKQAVIKRTEIYNVWVQS